MSGFFLVVFSALTHSVWNVLLKSANDKYVFNAAMHLVNLIFFTAVYPVFFPEYLYFDAVSVYLAFFAAVFFTLYHLAVSTAYSHEDVSLVYPVTTASPLFIVLWATLFFSESISPAGFAGIVTIIFGAVTLNGSGAGRLKISRGFVYALLAAFFYSVGSMMDKLGVVATNAILYVYCLSFFMTLFLILFSGKKIVSARFNENKPKVIFAGVVVFVSFLTYRYSLTMIEVSYAAALRQVNAFFAAGIAIIFFREPLSRRRIAGTVIIVAGAALIRLGM